MLLYECKQQLSACSDAASPGRVALLQEGLPLGCGPSGRQTYPLVTNELGPPQIVGGSH